MKVNELKALYQKKHIIIAQPQNPPIHNKIHPQPVPQPLPQPKPATEIKNPQEASFTTHQTVVTSDSIRKNTNFLEELNKKLQIKPRHSHQQQNLSYYSRGKTDIKAQPTEKQESKVQIQLQIETPSEIIRPKSKTFDVQIEQQLDFSKIIGNDSEGLVKSRIRARHAVDERHPITNQDKILFNELDSQIRETIEAENIEKQNKLRSQQESHKSINRQDIAKSIVESMKIDEKINRIDYFLACIFGEKERQFIGQKSMENIGPNIVDLFNEKMKTFKKQPLNSEVICLTSHSTQATVPSISPILKKQLPIIVPQAPIPSQKMTEQIKKQISSLPTEGQAFRPNLSMSKQMLQEMNMKLKRRNNLQQSVNPTDNNASKKANERSVSPIAKKKRLFEKFDDA